MSTRRPNAADERQVRKAKSKEEVLALKEAFDLREVLELPAGRRLIWRWLGDHGIYETSFDTNALTMARREGKRMAGLRMLDEVHEASPTLFLQMQSEAVAQEMREDDLDKRNEATEDQSTTEPEHVD